MARIFGAEEFGIFISAQTLLLTIAHSATLGLDKGLYWYLPQNGLHGRPRYDGIMESFWISAAIAILCTAVIFVGSFTPYISKELPYGILQGGDQINVVTLDGDHELVSRTESLVRLFKGLNAGGAFGQ